MSGLENSPRVQLVRLAMSYHTLFPGVTVFIAEPWRCDYLLKLATCLGYHPTDRGRSFARKTDTKGGVRVVAVGRTELVRSAMGIFIDPEVQRHERDQEFWATVDHRLVRIEQICGKGRNDARPSL